MPRISVEGTIGLVLEIALGILDHLHVKEPLLVWGLFVLGLILISDAVIRSDWAKRGNPAVKRRLFGMTPVLVFFGLFGWWIFGRTRQVASPQVAQAQTQSMVPKANTPPQEAPPKPAPSKKPTPQSGTKTRIRQSGHDNTANPGTINGDIAQAPCSVIQNGGSGNSASPKCGSPEATVSWKIKDVPHREALPGNATIVIELTVDQILDLPAFSVLCDRPCHITFAGANGLTGVEAIMKSGNKEAGVVLSAPRPLGPNVPVDLFIAGEDGSTPSILKVDKILRADLPKAHP